MRLSLSHIYIHSSFFLSFNKRETENKREAKYERTSSPYLFPSSDLPTCKYFFKANQKQPNQKWLSMLMQDIINRQFLNEILVQNMIQMESNVSFQIFEYVIYTKIVTITTQCYYSTTNREDFDHLIKSQKNKHSFYKIGWQY